MAEPTGAGAKDVNMMGADGYKDRTLFLDADGNEVERIARPGRRPLQPVGIWAQLECVKITAAQRVGTENEKNFFHDKDYRLLLLTNRTIKINSRTKKENHCYVPLENVGSYQVHRDAAFERRFEDTSDEGSTRDSAASGNSKENAG